MTDKVKKIEDAKPGTFEKYPYPGMYIAEVLKEQGVEVAFGVHGGVIWSMYDAMSNAGIKMVTVHHEQNAGFAAEAYAKVTNKPGVAFTTPGPGLANMITSIAQAYMSCSPMVVLYGGTEPENDGLYTMQPYPSVNSLREFTKWSQRLMTPNTYKLAVTRAFKDAQSYPKGPIALEFSKNGLLEDLPMEGVSAELYGQHNLYTEKWRGEQTAMPLSGGCAPELVEETVKALWAAERPVIMVADGTHWANASEELVKFIELAQIPISTRRIARGSVPETHPLYLDSRSGRPAIHNSDLLTIIGMKVGIYDAFGDKWPKVIQINETPDHIWTWLKTEVAVVGNPKVVLQQLIKYIKDNNLKPPAGRAEWVKKARAIQGSAYEEMLAKAEKYNNNTPIHWGYLSKVLWDMCEELYDGKNRVILDGYTISSFAPSFIRARYSGQVMDAAEHAGIGHSIGMAIGAAFGDPEAYKQPIIALLGDSGVGNSGMEIETAVHHHLPIVFVVTENQGWLTGLKYIHYGANWGALGQQDQNFGHEFSSNIRYDKLSEVFGCHGEYVLEPAQIRSAMERAFRAAESGQPAIVNLKMDPSISHRSIYNHHYGGSLAHIPWNKLAKKGKAIRRNLYTHMPWDEYGIPPMPQPNTWDPIAEGDSTP